MYDISINLVIPALLKDLLGKPRWCIIGEYGPYTSKHLAKMIGADKDNDNNNSLYNK